MRSRLQNARPGDTFSASPSGRTRQIGGGGGSSFS